MFIQKAYFQELTNKPLLSDYHKPKSVIRDFGEQSVMNYYQLLKKIYYFTHYNCYISCVFLTK